jgi:hypothetical protein
MAVVSGAAVSWPLAARAQQATHRHASVGSALALLPHTVCRSRHLTTAYAFAGLFEGRNVTIEYQTARRSERHAIGANKVGKECER